MSAARRYQITGLIGRGGFGSVYAADVQGAGITRQVAIKLLEGATAPTADQVRRLRNEARVLAALNHRAIVRVDEFVELDGVWAVVMEHVVGVDLSALVARGPVPPAVAVAIVIEVASALHAAWNQPGRDGEPLHLMHRDIKPGNIRLTATGEVKLLDFGIARAERRDDATATQGVLGTMAYMGAERLLGQNEPGSDVYALGVVLFELLIGQKPGSSAADPARLPPSDLDHAPPAWRAIADLSPELARLLAAMLHPDVTRRPTARECARLLDPLRLSLPGGALEDWAEIEVPRLIQAPQRDDARTGTLLVEGLPRRRLPWVGVAVGLSVGAVALAACGGLGLASVWALRDTPSEPLVVTVLPATPAPNPPEASATPGGAEPASNLGAPPAPEPAAPITPTLPPPTAPPVAAPPAATAPAASRASAPRSSPSTSAAPAAAVPTPTTPSPPSTGTLSVSGDATAVVATCGGATLPLPAEVPAGSCTVTATFADGRTSPSLAVNVPAGGTAAVRCTRAFSICAPR